VRDVLPTLEKKFDVIVCDLFDGPKVSDAFREERVVGLLRDVLSIDGYLLLNVFREPDVYVKFDAALSRWSDWQYKWNHLALYRQFGRGKVGDPLADGYRPARTFRAYLEREGSTSKQYCFVGSDRCPGVRWHFGPLWFEGYLGDEVPILEPYAKTRLVIWQPVSRCDAPLPWRRSWLPADPQLTGHGVIENPEVYWKDWSSHMQRYRKKWLKTRPYDIRDVSAEVFLASYGNKRMSSWLVGMTVELMKAKVRAHGERVHFLGAVDPATGKLVGGFCYVDVPEAHVSIHLASFVKKEVKRTSVGVGMVDRWFADCASRGIVYPDFDLFWAFGDPWSWRGFSRFKSQFGTRFVRHPHAFMRLVWGTRSLEQTSTG